MGTTMNFDLTGKLTEEEILEMLERGSSVDGAVAKKQPPKSPWWADQAELSPDTRMGDVDPTGTRSLHKTTNMASQEARDWATNQQSRFGKVKNMLKSGAPVAKQVGKQAIKGGLGLAGLLAQEELGPESGSDDELVEDPSQPLEVRKAAMMRLKNKYLKPQEDNE
jgi:hypothetical protein